MRQVCLLAFFGLFIASVSATTAKEAKEAYLRDLERRIEQQVEKVAEEVGRKTAEEEAEEKAEGRKKKTEANFDFEAEEATKFGTYNGGWKPYGSLYKYAGTQSSRQSRINQDESGLGSPSREQSIIQNVKKGPLPVVKVSTLHSMIMLRKTPFVLDSE